MQKEWYKATKPLSITRERGQCVDHGTLLSCTSRFSEKKNPTGKIFATEEFSQTSMSYYRSPGKQAQQLARNGKSTWQQICFWTFIILSVSSYILIYTLQQSHYKQCIKSIS